MKDFYASLGLRSFENDVNKIKAAIKLATPFLAAEAEAVLLNKGRKEVYDRSFRALSVIGRLRSNYGITTTDNWGANYRDFDVVLNSPPVKPASKHRNLYVSIVIGLMLIALFFFFQNTFMETDEKDWNRILSDIIAEGSRESTKATDSVVSQSDIDYLENQNNFEPIEYFVTSNRLNLRDGSSINGEILMTLDRYSRITLLSVPVNGWARVSSGEVVGYVSEKYISAGNGRQAYINYCDVNSGLTPRNGEVLSQMSIGENTLEVKAPFGDDVVIKLKDGSGNSVLSGYVKSSQTATFDKVPDGMFKFQYASGKSYSRACNIFTKNMSASSANDFEKYESTSRFTTIMTYQLTKVSNGNFSPSKLDLSSF